MTSDVSGIEALLLERLRQKAREYVVQIATGLFRFSVQFGDKLRRQLARKGHEACSLIEFALLLAIRRCGGAGEAAFHRRAFDGIGGFQHFVFFEIGFFHRHGKSFVKRWLAVAEHIGAFPPLRAARDCEVIEVVGANHICNHAPITLHQLRRVR